MATARRTRKTQAEIANQIYEHIVSKLAIGDVSPIPPLPDYEGDQDPKSDEFMRDKIKRAKNEAYGVEPTELDYSYWIQQMTHSVDAGWAPYWDDRLRGDQAGLKDRAKYGKFARGSVTSGKNTKRNAGCVAKALAQLAMNIAGREGAPGDKGDSGQRKLTTDEEAEFKVLLKACLDGTEAPSLPVDTTPHTYNEPEPPAFGINDPSLE